MNANTAALLGVGCDCEAQHTSTLGIIATPEDGWAFFQWVDWHKQLVKTYKENGYSEAKAQEYAKKIFLTWWDKLNSFWGEQNWCGYKPEFYTYFKSVGITDHISALASLVAPVFTAGVSSVEKTSEVIQNTGDTASTLSKVLKVLIPVAVTGVVVGVGYYGYKHYIKGNEKIKVPKPGLKGISAKKTSKKVIHI